MDWQEQMRDDIEHILNVTGTQLPPPRPVDQYESIHASSPLDSNSTQNMGKSTTFTPINASAFTPINFTPTNKTSPQIKQDSRIKQEPTSPDLLPQQQRAMEPEARRVLRELVPKFHKLNELLIKAYEENDLKAAEELRKRLNWAIGDHDGGRK